MAFQEMSVGIGFCDSCLIRLYEGEQELTVEDNKVYCEDCKEVEDRY